MYNTEAIYKAGQKTLILEDTYYCRKSLVVDVLREHFKASDQPVVLVSKGAYDMAEIWGSLKSNGYPYDFRDINYAEINEIEAEENTPDSKVLFNIDASSRGIHLAIELAMLLNRKLLNLGFKPLVILFAFEDIFDMFYQESLAEFFEEVIVNEISNEQKLFIVSQWIYSGSPNDNIRELSNLVEKYVDSLVIQSKHVTRIDGFREKYLAVLSVGRNYSVCSKV